MSFLPSFLLLHVAKGFGAAFCTVCAQARSKQQQGLWGCTNLQPYSPSHQQQPWPFRNNKASLEGSPGRPPPHPGPPSASQAPSHAAAQDTRTAGRRPALDQHREAGGLWGAEGLGPAGGAHEHQQHPQLSTSSWLLHPQPVAAYLLHRPRSMPQTQDPSPRMWQEADADWGRGSGEGAGARGANGQEGSALWGPGSGRSSLGGGPLVGRKRGSMSMEPQEQPESVRRSLNGGGHLPLRGASLPPSPPPPHGDGACAPQPHATLRAHPIFPTSTSPQLSPHASPSHPSTSPHCPLSPLSPHQHPPPSRGSSAPQHTLPLGCSPLSGARDGSTPTHAQGHLLGNLLWPSPATHSQAGAAAAPAAPAAGASGSELRGHAGCGELAGGARGAPPDAGDSQRYLRDRALHWNRTALVEMEHDGAEGQEPDAQGGCATAHGAAGAGGREGSFSSSPSSPLPPGTGHGAPPGAAGKQGAAGRAGGGLAQRRLSRPRSGQQMPGVLEYEEEEGQGQGGGQGQGRDSMDEAGLCEAPEPTQHPAHQRRRHNHQLPAGDGEGGEGGGAVMDQDQPAPHHSSPLTHRVSLSQGMQQLSLRRANSHGQLPEVGHIQHRLSWAHTEGAAGAAHGARRAAEAAAAAPLQGSRFVHHARTPSWHALDAPLPPPSPPPPHPTRSRRVSASSPTPSPGPSSGQFVLPEPDQPPPSYVEGGWRGAWWRSCSALLPASVARTLLLPMLPMRSTLLRSALLRRAPLPQLRPAGSPGLITGLKQRMLAHLLQCAVQRGRETGGSSAAGRQQHTQLELQKFYRSFEEMRALVIWRVGARARARTCVCTEHVYGARALLAFWVLQVCTAACASVPPANMA